MTIHYSFFRIVHNRRVEEITHVNYEYIVYQILLTAALRKNTVGIGTISNRLLYFLVVKGLCINKREIYTRYRKNEEVV